MIRKPGFREELVSETQGRFVHINASSVPFCIHTVIVLC